MLFNRKFALGCAIGLGITLPILGDTKNLSAQFGFLQNTPGSDSSFGVQNWTNGFSGALVQLAPYQQLPNSAPQFASSRRLQLGVVLENTTTGVVIQSVLPGSIAEANGLGVGDVIVAVSGYQVGIVNDKVYDAVDEIQKRMGPDGRCNILVLSRSNGRLISAPLNASSSVAPVVSGQAGMLQALSIPPGSILRVELRNMTRPYQQIAGGSDIHSVNGFGPYPFEIHYDPNYIDAQDQYRLIASVTSYQGELLLEGFTDLRAPQGSINTSITLQRPQVITASANVSAGYRPNQSAVYSVFREILQRDPNAMELNAWTDALARGSSLEKMKADLLASPQFYDLSGNDNRFFAERLIQTITRRQPTASEVAAVLSRLNSMPRMRVVQEYLASSPR